jgi:hypothetical protein
MVCFSAHWLPLPPMSRRIDIELTSSLNDGTWTWRAAGARQPRGVLDGSILPGGSKVGDELKVEVEQELEGITVLSVVGGREKHDRDLLALLPVEKEFQPVIETRAKRERGERPRRDDGDRRPRRDRGDGPGGDRPRRGAPGGAREQRGDRPSGGAGAGDGDRGRREGAGRGDARSAGRGDSRGDSRGGGESRGGGRDRRSSERRGPSFTPPPEIPQRPKPKRLRPGKTNRTAVLSDLPAEQRPIAELALQGIGAVRQRLREENERAVAEGRPTMPEASVLKLAEELLPRLRVAEWRDRAEAAKAQAVELDLRDLRSVVAASGDPAVARDETTRQLADELRQVLTTKQEQELQFWYADIDAALAVGRVIRALRLSSQPPKAGVPFPSDIAQRLADSTNASLAPMDAPDRWAAMLEAAAFSPVRALVKPIRKPDVVNDELIATVTRLAPALPQVAALFEIEVNPKAPMPKPLRPTPRTTTRGKDSKPGDAKHGEGKHGEGKQDRPPRGERKPKQPTTDAQTAPKGGSKPAPQSAPSSAGDAEPGVDHETVAQPAPDTAPAAASAAAPAAETAPEAVTPPEDVSEPTPTTAAADTERSEPVADTTPAPEPVAETETAAATQRENEPEPKPVADAASGPETSAAPEPAAEPRTEPEPQAVAPTRAETASDQQASTETRPQNVSEPKPEHEPELQPGAGRAPEPETSSGPQPVAEPHTQPEPQAVAHTDTQAVTDERASTEAPGASDLADSADGDATDS